MSRHSPDAATLAERAMRREPALRAVIERSPILVDGTRTARVEKAFTDLLSDYLTLARAVGELATALARAEAMAERWRTEYRHAFEWGHGPLLASPITMERTREGGA